MLIIKDFVKHYGKKEAVKGINLTVKPGEIYGFLGHNGAGKTTTMKACTGLIKPTSGQIFICGYDISRQPLEAKKQIGFVPDNPYLYDKLSGREFLRVVGNMHLNKQHDLIKYRMDELILMMDLEDEIDHLIGTYSFGTKKKISLCAAFLHHPKVIFLDEPTSGLDAKSAKLAKELFKEHAKRGAAIMFTTHVLEIAEKLCDIIGIIYQGRLVCEGTIEELRARYEKEGSSLEDIFLDVTNDQDVFGKFL